VVIYRFADVEAPPARGKEEGNKATRQPGHQGGKGQPASAPAANYPTIVVEPIAYRFRYADGPADAEAFCVQPQTGDGYIVTKRFDAANPAVYKLSAPWNAAQETVLPRLLTLELPPALPLARVVTAADIAPDGRRLAVRCYLDGWEWRLPTDVPVRDFDRIFATTPLHLSLPAEPQGEALCYELDGRFFLTISEGRQPTLYQVGARP
jgi:hypothetical protein